MAQIVSAAGMILFTRSQPTQFLLLKHSNRWDLPKGHAEPNEDNLQTALRETQEETGISADNIEVDPNFRHVMEYSLPGGQENRRKRVTYFLGYIQKPLPVTLTEHIDFAWWPWPVSSPIQAQTIDPLLTEVARFFNGQAVGRQP